MFVLKQENENSEVTYSSFKFSFTVGGEKEFVEMNEGREIMEKNFTFLLFFFFKTVIYFHAR